ncbi:MAG: type II toxin-antitoxin system VapC family toxin [Anaerolineae bacterium]|nr:type II toxin-antitoxin system VapC family toxin [Anaerolineae bacterium]
MVLDTSVLIAILMSEPEARAMATILATADERLLSAASLLETSIVIESRYGLAGGEKLNELIQTAQIKIEPVTHEQVTAARLAYRTYGKGRHPAGLNFGDCFAYALAKTTGEPLLFIGNDFNQTDIPAVPYSHP